MDSREVWENNFLKMREGSFKRRGEPVSGAQQLLDLLALIPIVLSIAKDELPKQVREVMVAFARRGWFLTGDFYPTDLLRWKALVKSRDGSVIDHHFAEHFRKRVKTIEETLISLFPTRKKILQAAFRAHKRKDYALSVPVFLIQADGICWDKLGFLLFRRDRKTGGQPIIASHLKGLDIHPGEQALLEAITMELPLNAKIDSLNSTERRYNRHAILHGLVNDYDTEDLSLKSISLLAFLADNVPRLLAITKASTAQPQRPRSK